MVDREMLSAISGLLDEKLEQKFDEKLQPVYDRLDGLETNVIPRLDGLETDVGGLKADVQDLKMDVGDLKTDVGDLKTDVGDLKTDVGDLKTDVGGLKADVQDLKMDVGDLKTDVGSLKADVSGLKGEMRYIRVVQLENNVIPRLSTIESCYLDTSRRYMDRTEQIDNMTANIEVLKSVVSEHSRKLEKIPG